MEFYMKNEDALFEKLELPQRGFQAKRQMAADKLKVEEDDDIQDYKRPWVDLSDSQIEQVYHDVAKLHRGAAMPWGQIQFGRALQALIKEKNT